MIALKSANNNQMYSIRTSSKTFNLHCKYDNALHNWIIKTNIVLVDISEDNS